MIRRLVLPATFVVLALVLGLVVGASLTSGRLVAAVATDRSALSGQVAGLRGQVSDDADRLSATERFVATTAATTVHGTLTGRSVALVTAPDADPGDVAYLADLLARSGAQTTGRLTLTDAALAPERAESVRTLVPRLLPASASLPASADSGSRLGALVGAVAVRGAKPVTPVDAVTALSGLADAGLIAPTPAVAPAPAQLVLVVAGASTDSARGAALTRFAAALDRPGGGGGVVLAGRDGSAAVAAAGADPATRAAVSSVAGLQRPSGRLAGVLALREQTEGRAGPFGPAASPRAS